ncbi:uncharacterized protein LACBIDRAFT_314254 [Laccaria bicolor S238N-H82]|uniref:Predicted protein n=1 Tax=Laccaria bicolor (strain S238N-H82 / ATCC MYA-4686) TaxID=486041 RepID=B0D1X6_LACBS|nr:uncharacterized protein LACBIDRAFT_314254 [Laccaria bicolor S238N-H82]EDR12068.1 predicted protein [Laccaria bicolor S238N-H82]|eukprot:XP_001877965.1 predicted protein [Laccaria bicolor S238N-H82]
MRSALNIVYLRHSGPNPPLLHHDEAHHAAMRHSTSFHSDHSAAHCPGPHEIVRAWPGGRTQRVDGRSWHGHIQRWSWTRQWHLPS